MNKERSYFSENPRTSSRNQFEFNQGESGFETPRDLQEDYPEIFHYLANQKLWENCLEKTQKNNGVAVLLDFQENTAFSFNPHNWQEKRKFSLQDPLPEETGGVLLICSSWENKEEEVLETTSLFLPENAPVFIFEALPQKESIGKEALAKESQKRKRILQNLGLAEAKVLTRPSPQKENNINNFLVWRARMPKEWHPRKSVNLLDEGPFWKRNWIRRLLTENENQYEENGYQIINDEAIKNSLRKTTFPLNVVGQAKLGFGYELEAPCGCRWEVNLNGDWTRLYQCEADCEG